MEVEGSGHLHVREDSQVGEARRRAQRLAHSLGLGETDTGRVALVATELATNLVKHAGGGELTLGAIEESGAVGVELVALDRGGGIRDVGGALRDGYSTSGSAGTGLGAISRLASRFDIFTGKAGTVLLARVLPARAADARDRFQVGAVSVPFPGEPVSGDGWAMQEAPQRGLFLVVDGLGHGDAAAEAAGAARACFLQRGQSAPAAIMHAMHGALRHTRGAAAAVAEVDAAAGQVRYCGVGNISGSILTGAETQNMISLNGTLGHELRTIQEFNYRWSPESLLVMHSDGVSTRWTLELYPGLRARHAAVIAAVLVRDFARGRDDATVLAARALPGIPAGAEVA